MLDLSDTQVICIDIQEKLVNMLSEKTVSINAEKLIKASSILNIPVLITEQYPKGLGSTIKEIKEINNFKTIEKTTFSALKTDEIKKEIKQNLKNIILFGIETHICVYQTALDLKKENYEVYIVSDCCASRNTDNHKCSLELMKQEGIKITTLEIVLFELLKSSKHPDFKEIQSLIK